MSGPRAGAGLRFRPAADTAARIAAGTAVFTAVEVLRVSEVKA